MKLLHSMIILTLASVLMAQPALKQNLSSADSLMQKGKLDEAVGILKACTENYPDNSKVWMKYGQAAGSKSGIDFEKGNLTEAMNGVNAAFDALEKSIFLDDKNVEACIFYGVMGIKVPVFFGKLKPAVQYLEKARNVLEEMPSKDNLDQRLTVYRYLGEGYKMQNRFSEAGINWKLCLTLSSEGEHADAARNGLKALKEIASSEASAQSVKAPETDDVASLLQIGRDYLAAKKFQEARAAFEKILSIDEKHVEAQLLLIQTIAEDVQQGYDKRIYESQDTRTQLAFDMVREMGKGLALDPKNNQLKLQYAMTCIYMPFFVGKIDEGLAILEELLNDAALSDSVKQDIMFGLGFGYTKKGNALWAKLVQSDQESQAAKSVYEYYGLRDFRSPEAENKACVDIAFHLGFQDELAPQTAVWIEDADGQFVKTVYVSGFAGYAKEKQITLQKWGESTKFETDGTTGASIDWGTHHYVWNLTDHQGKRVKDGSYKVWLEVSWWPTFRYALVNADIQVGKKDQKVKTDKQPFIPLFKVAYITKK